MLQQDSIGDGIHLGRREVRSGVVAVGIALLAGALGGGASAQLVSPLVTPDQLNSAIAAKPGAAAYAQTAYGPAATTVGTVSLLGATANYGFGSASGKPLLRCDYVGQSYTAILHGNYSLATVPGNVSAVLTLGDKTITATIPNLVTGTPGQWWDAEADITCATVGTNTATINLGSTITFQAAGGVTAAIALGRGQSPITIATNGGAFGTDVSRTFTMAGNSMQIETLTIMWVR